LPPAGIIATAALVDEDAAVLLVNDDAAFSKACHAAAPSLPWHVQEDGYSFKEVYSNKNDNKTDIMSELVLLLNNSRTTMLCICDSMIKL
jgi:hypothetical protein